MPLTCRRSSPAWNGSTAAASSRPGSSHHGLAHGGAHAAAGSEHANPDHGPDPSAGPGAGHRARGPHAWRVGRAERQAVAARARARSAAVTTMSSSASKGPTTESTLGATSTRCSTRATSSRDTARSRARCSSIEISSSRTVRLRAEAGHATAAVLQAEQGGALEVAEGHVVLGLGDPVGEDALDDGVDDLEQLGQASGRRARVHGVARRCRRSSTATSTRCTPAPAPPEPAGRAGSTCLRP